jgi:4-amino-4-deoxy-L-arabinose transferase-like glycosyltransferase
MRRIRRPTGFAGWIVLGCLASTAAAGLALAVLGEWRAAPVAAAMVVSIVVASGMAVAAFMRGRQGPVVPALAWAGVVGLVVVGLGAPPEPWAADTSLPPAAVDALALGGPRVMAGVVWVVAAIAGIAALTRGQRARRGTFEQ